VVGGNVDIGDAVQVDYTTPDPTIIAVGKEWATWDELYRMLAKYKIPEPEEPITEFDKVMLFCHRDPSQYQTFPATCKGISAALNVAYNYDEGEYGDFQGFGHWSIRIPPLEISPVEYGSWGYELNVYRPIHIWSEGQVGARIHGYTAFYGGGSTFENIHFYWDAEQSKGQYPVYNVFLTMLGNDDNDYIMNDGDLTITSGSAYDARFDRCKFTSFGYDGMSESDPEPVKGNHHYSQYSNVWLNPPDGSNDMSIIFEDCDFYAMSRVPAWNSGAVLEETWIAGDGVGRMHVIFSRCRIAENMHKPFDVNTDTTSEPNVKSITTSNSQWHGLTDVVPKPDRIYDGGQWLLDSELDLAPADHIHGSSGSSGGHDADAFHVNESGEY
jgi:hypothetical protein